jgi:hypothetical protein
LLFFDSSIPGERRFKSFSILNRLIPGHGYAFAQHTKRGETMNIRLPISTAIKIFFTALALFACKAHAKSFKNAYIAFDMQDNWKCELEQTEWVCRAEDPQEAKEAVIILTAKEKGPTDSFPLYETHLNTPINTVSRNGEVMASILKYKAVKAKINDHYWIDSLHQNSEVKNYFTRYMGTIKDQIAILVTFSAHNKYYAKHSGNFDKTIRSLRVVGANEIHKFLASEGQFFGNEKFGRPAGATEILAGPNEISRSPASYIYDRKKELALKGLYLIVLIFLISKVMSRKKLKK